MKTVNNFNEALFIYAVYSSSSERAGAKLENIIAYNDYLNHTIPTYSEFIDSGIKLINAGLIKQTGNEFHVTIKFKDWFIMHIPANKSTHIEIIKSVQKFLGKEFTASFPDNSNSLLTISENDFKAAVTDYLHK